MIFFKEKPLYDAKKNTLILGIQLINERSKALHDVLVLINEELTEINQRLISEETLESTEAEIINQWLTRKVELEQFKGLITLPAGYIRRSCNEITAENNADLSHNLFIYDPFSFGSKDNLLHLERLGYSYFSDPDFLRINSTKSAFTAAQNYEIEMWRFRRNMSGALVTTAMLVAFATGLAAGIFITLCANPIIGQSIVFLVSVGFTYYLNCRFDDDLKSAQDSCTTVAGPIDVGRSSNPKLFSELDELQDMCDSEKAPQP